MCKLFSRVGEESPYWLDYADGMTLPELYVFWHTAKREGASWWVLFRLEAMARKIRKQQ